MQTHTTNNQQDWVQSQEIHGYELLEQIGMGGFGIVYKCKHIESGEIYALKGLRQVVDIPEKEFKELKDSLIEEGKLMEKLEHENIVQVKEIFVDYFCGVEMPFVVLEFCDDSLSHYIKERNESDKKMGIDEIMILFSQILNGLKYLHSKKIMHKDIKTQNILIKDHKAKITDFGLSEQIKGEFMKTNHGYGNGTLTHLAPEMIEQYIKQWENDMEQSSAIKQKILSIDYKIDIWALGILLFKMLVGFLPFRIPQQPYESDLEVMQTQYEEIYNLCTPQFDFQKCVERERERAKVYKYKANINSDIPKQFVNLFESIFELKNFQRLSYTTLCSHHAVKPYISNIEEFNEVYKIAPKLVHMHSKIYDEVDLEKSDELEEDDEVDEQEMKRATEVRRRSVQTQFSRRMKHFNTKILITNTQNSTSVSKNMEVYILYMNRYQYLFHVSESQFNVDYLLQHYLDDYKTPVNIEFKFFCIKAALYYAQILESLMAETENVFQIENWHQYRNSTSAKQIYKQVVSDIQTYNKYLKEYYEQVQCVDEDLYEIKELKDLINLNFNLNVNEELENAYQKKVLPKFIVNLEDSIKLPLRNSCIQMHNALFLSAQESLQNAQNIGSGKKGLKGPGKVQKSGVKSKSGSSSSIYTNTLQKNAKEYLKDSLQVLVVGYIFRIYNVQKNCIDFDKFNSYKIKQMALDKSLSEYSIFLEWLQELEIEQIYEALDYIIEKNIKGDLLEKMESYKFLKRQKEIQKVLGQI